MNRRIDSQKGLTPAARCMRDARAAAKAVGYYPRNYRLPVSLVQKIDRLKRLRGQRNRDSIFNAIIRSVCDLSPDSFTLPPPHNEPTKQVTFMINKEMEEVVYRLARYFRNIPPSVALEIILLTAPELRGEPEQLDILGFLEGDAVSG